MSGGGDGSSPSAVAGVDVDMDAVVAVSKVVSVPGGTTDEETVSEPFGSIFGIINAGNAL